MPAREGVRCRRDQANANRNCTIVGSDEDRRRQMRGRFYFGRPGIGQGLAAPQPYKLIPRLGLSSIDAYFPINSFLSSQIRATSASRAAMRGSATTGFAVQTSSCPLIGPVELPGLGVHRSKGFLGLYEIDDGLRCYTRALKRAMVIVTAARAGL